jgi:hypothetical protein
VGFQNSIPARNAGLPSFTAGVNMTNYEKTDTSLIFAALQKA